LRPSSHVAPVPVHYRQFLTVHAAPAVAGKRGAYGPDRVGEQFVKPDVPEYVPGRRPDAVPAATRR
ncbi:hypothetical protein WAJ74_22300, partial [Acinetobacter baumannii]